LRLDLGDSAVNHLVTELEKATILGEYIETNDYQRGIGKSTAIVKFARKYGLTVVVRDRAMASYFNNDLDYDNVVSQQYAKSLRGRRLVFDEFVDPTMLPKDSITTGFVIRHY
jgi:hypothetical protein